MKTVNLQLSQQLKASGYPQESDIYFVNHNMGKLMPDPNGWILANKDHSPFGGSFRNITHKVSSPTADEILDQLVEELDINKSSEEPFDKWQIDCGEVVESDNCLANAAAKAWLHLKKEGLL